MHKTAYLRNLEKRYKVWYAIEYSIVGVGGSFYFKTYDNNDFYRLLLDMKHNRHYIITCAYHYSVRTGRRLKIVYKD